MKSPYEVRRGDYLVTDDRARLDLDMIHAALSTAYWSPDVPRSTVERSIAHSLPFGLFKGESQIGFARVVTDYAAFAWLCDVIVLEAHRGRGLGAWLVEAVLAHPELQGLRRWTLATRDAHDLYRRFGFVEERERYMHIARPNLYGPGKS